MRNQTALLLLVLACKSEKKPPAPPPVIAADAAELVPPPGTTMTFTPGKAPEYAPSPIADLPELPPPSKDKPSKASIDALVELCGLGDQNPDETKGALQGWLAKHAENVELATLFTSALGNGDRAAIATLRAGGDAAVGVGKCGFLDFMMQMALRQQGAAK